LNSLSILLPSLFTYFKTVIATSLLLFLQLHSGTDENLVSWTT